jgi:pyruvate formate lyase activating enzyme
VGGTLYTTVYGRLVAAHVDPIEKKPLYHFLPGTHAYSIATAGCNFRCRWCQNWSISQMTAERGGVEVEEASAEEVVRAARASGCASIAYTYTEPTVFLEFALDTARTAREAGLMNSFVTNGFMTAAALDLITPHLDAANVDLKAFNEDTYRTCCGGRLAPVLDSLRRMKGSGIWVEVTTLLVQGINDSSSELARIADFLVEELGPETPWHISRSHPAYEMGSLTPTPLPRLEEALRIGRHAGLHHVYVGNASMETPTVCATCGTVLIRRERFEVIARVLTAAGSCPRCGAPLAGKGLEWGGDGPTPAPYADHAEGGGCVADSATS